jgi:hypothetical protein
VPSLRRQSKARTKAFEKKSANNYRFQGNIRDCEAYLLVIAAEVYGCDFLNVDENRFVDNGEELWINAIPQVFQSGIMSDKHSLRSSQVDRIITEEVLSDRWSPDQAGRQSVSEK